MLEKPFANKFYQKINIQILEHRLYIHLPTTDLPIIMLVLNLY